MRRKGQAQLPVRDDTVRARRRRANGRGRRARAARRAPARRNARPGRYCSTDCQRIDWRDRGHRKACKKIRAERAAEAARTEAPTPPPEEVVYGPAPRSHADEVRARIAAEHEAARLRREANPEPKPVSARRGSRCPICLEEWDVNAIDHLRPCCCRTVCESCERKLSIDDPCPLCRAPYPKTFAAHVALMRRHVEDGLPEAFGHLGDAYRAGELGLVKSEKKASKLFKRGVELGDVSSMVNLGQLYTHGLGVKRDLKKATQLMRMASESGLAMAQQNLGVLLSMQAMHVEAVQYFTLAAEQGFFGSFNSLGICYECGDGVPKDIRKALDWYKPASCIRDDFREILTGKTMKNCYRRMW